VALTPCGVLRYRSFQPRLHGWVLFLVALLALGSEPASGQSIHGRVLIQGDTAAVTGADLTLSDSVGAVLSRVQADDFGNFRLPAPGPGTYRVSVSRIGFSPISVQVQLRDREAVEVELRMSEEAIPLDPIVVVGRRQIREGTLDEFYDRMARNRQRGVGHFLTKEQIENRISMTLPMLLQTLPGVWLSSGGGSIKLLNTGNSDGVFCTPEYILDGLPMLGGYRAIQVLDLEGVEVYRGYSEVIHGYFPNSCGLVFLWRKKDWGNPLSWGRFFLAVGLLAVGWAISSLF
jgi:hypothetical protein